MFFLSFLHHSSFFILHYFKPRFFATPPPSPLSPFLLAYQILHVFFLVSLVIN